MSVYVYASLCDFVCIALLIIFVLGFCLSVCLFFLVKFVALVIIGGFVFWFGGSLLSFFNYFLIFKYLIIVFILITLFYFSYLFFFFLYSSLLF